MSAGDSYSINGDIIDIDLSNSRGTDIIVDISEGRKEIERKEHEIESTTHLLIVDTTLPENQETVESTSILSSMIPSTATSKNEAGTSTTGSRNAVASESHHRRRRPRSDSMSTTLSGSSISAGTEPPSSGTVSTGTTSDTSSPSSSFMTFLCRLVGSPTMPNSCATIRMRHRLRSASLTLAMTLCLLSMAYVTRRLGDPPRRHPLTLRATAPEQSANRVRYLTFGSSNAWGAGLGGSGTRGLRQAFSYRRAFPYQLSPLVHNAANHLGGMELSALCTQSVVGDDARYDAIVLEVSDDTLNNSTGLRLLAQRLHKRFPNAAMVFVDLWTPAQYITETDEMTFDQFRKLQKQRHLQHANFIQQVNYVKWVDNESAVREEQLQKIAEDVHGLVYRLPRPTEDSSMGDYLGLFVDAHLDSEPTKYTLSPRGHQIVAKGIKKLIAPLNLLQQTYSLRNAVRSWGSGDACQLWYETGDISAIGSRESMRFRQFSTTRDKYALEVPQETGGSFTVRNPFDEDRMVYLSYMTTSPTSHPHKIYPRTRLELNGKSSVVLDPYHNNNLENRHLVRTTAVGVIPANSDAVLRLESMEQTLAEFRVVGVSLFATEKRNRKIRTEFAFEPEPATVGRLYKHFW